MAAAPARRRVVSVLGFKFTTRAPGVAHRSRRHCSLRGWCVWAHVTSVFNFLDMIESKRLAI